MNILFGTQFYTPTIGGVQEVMRQLAEKLVKKGHRVTIATTSSADRAFEELNGVIIKEFSITGNYATGMQGEVKKYQHYITSNQFDLLMVMAAQQWTFDALWPILDQLTKTKTVFIPCGFSGLHDPIFSDYFQKMPNILAKLDHLIFHSTDYRDINFAKEHGINKLSIIPCGASDEDFKTIADPTFRARHGIHTDSFLFLTVGTFTGIKGHLELSKAFSLMALPKGQTATLILNGNTLSQFDTGAGNLLHKVFSTIKTRGVSYLIKLLINKFLKIETSPHKIARTINKTQLNKQVLITNFSRTELIQTFINADLFVFASNIEYSPLVLFETAAAGTPFLSVDVGNTPEISEWTGAGVICESSVDDLGYTRVNEHTLAKEMLALMNNPKKVKKLGNEGKKRWQSNYSWSKIADRYEDVFIQLLNN